jgi:hypothetical protein
MHPDDERFQATRSDKLRELSACAAALILAGLRSPDAVRNATPAQLAKLRPQDEVIVSPVECGDPLVMRLLFTPLLCWLIDQRDGHDRELPVGDCSGQPTGNESARKFKPLGSVAGSGSRIRT